MGSAATAVWSPHGPAMHRLSVNPGAWRPRRPFCCALPPSQPSLCFLSLSRSAVSPFFSTFFLGLLFPSLSLFPLDAHPFFSSLCSPSLLSFPSSSVSSFLLHHPPTPDSLYFWINGLLPFTQPPKTPWGIRTSKLGSQPDPHTPDKRKRGLPEGIEGVGSPDVCAQHVQGVIFAAILEEIGEERVVLFATPGH